MVGAYAPGWELGVKGWELRVESGGPHRRVIRNREHSIHNP
jgi:hypothetical protein